MTPEQAIKRYENLRKNCAKKQIPFTLTLKQWCDAWEGKTEFFGILQLQRIDKEKGFIAGNITIGEKPKKKHGTNE